MSPEDLCFRLELLSGCTLRMRINRNRVSVLSKREESWGYRISVHERFLEAPAEVIAAVAAWVRGASRRDHQVTLRRFISEMETGRRSAGPVETAGRFHDLRLSYDRVNGEYFGGDLELAITWFAPRRRRRRQRCTTLGQYCDQRELIRINRVLDARKVPQYFVDFVVYHEMVHHIVPGTIDRAGRKRVHNRAFREMEKQFKHYGAAKEWEKKKGGWT